MLQTQIKKNILDYSSYPFHHILHHVWPVHKFTAWEMFLFSFLVGISRASAYFTSQGIIQLTNAII